MTPCLRDVTDWNHQRKGGERYQSRSPLFKSITLFHVTLPSIHSSIYPSSYPSSHPSIYPSIHSSIAFNSIPFLFLPLVAAAKHSQYIGDPAPLGPCTSFSACPCFRLLSNLIYPIDCIRPVLFTTDTALVPSSNAHKMHKTPTLLPRYTHTRAPFH